MFTTLCGLLVSCSVYDPEFITDNPGQPLEGEPSMPAPEPDAGLEADDAAIDAAEPMMPPISPVPLDTTRCGDGRVTGNENCDTGIEAGAPGACPTACPELAACNPRALNNSGCQAECVVLQLTCKDGDGCCPGGCSSDLDDDCSTSCGDGVIQVEGGETCEAETETPCKQTAAECDDDDACTEDALIGSAENCNALCTNVRIETAMDGDGCCPSGNNANTDGDCMPVCGNMVREAGEECDGSAGCNASCRLPMLQADQMRCLEKFAGEGDACARCACMNCTASYLACRDSMDAARDGLCKAVIDCARAKDCYGTACYCGDAFLCLEANGECKAQIEAAAGSTDPLVVSDRSRDTNFAVGRAYAADTCLMTQCAEQCRM